MSLLASGVLANPETPYFTNGMTGPTGPAGPKSAGLQYYSVSPSKYISTGSASVIFNLPVSTIAGKTYNMSANLGVLSLTSSVTVSNDAFVMTMANASGATTNGYITGLMPIGLYNFSANAPVGVSQTLSGLTTNMAADTLSLYVSLDTGDDPAGIYELSVRNTIINQLN
jgi:hypothetical protein